MAVGCGSHQAVIVDRSGATVATAETLIEAEWSRVLDDTSAARIVVRPDGDCCQAMGRVRSWRHRLDLYREGIPVWSGPIITITWSAEEVQVVAADITAWLDRRVPHRDMRFVATDLSVVAERLISDGFAPDDPGHEVQIVGPSHVRGDREYEEDVGQTGDHLRDLLNTGIDMTTVGSRILILPEDHCDRVGSLGDDDFPEGLTVVEDGAALATRWVIHGNTNEDEAVKGVAGGTDGYYRLLERVDEETSILDSGSAAAAARSRLRASQPAPVFIDSQTATLSPDAPVEVASLVPGWCLDITSTATCRTIQQTMKLFALTVSETADGETVGVTIAPAGV